jgi:hypothetical protein
MSEEAQRPANALAPCTEMADLDMVLQKWEAGFQTSELELRVWDNFIGIDEPRAGYYNYR